MSRITPMIMNASSRAPAVRVPLAVRDVLFIAAVASVSVGGSVVMTLAQIGPDRSALSTAVLIPLLVSIPVATYLVRQHSRIAALNAQLNELVRRDALTGLLNRRAFLAAAESGGKGALILVDADRFKAVNDTWGHPAGDSVLVQIASRLGTAAGPGAIVGRLGGEEFAVFVPGLAAPQAATLAEALRAIVADRPVQHDHVAINCSISLGLAMVEPETVRLAEAMTVADAALYRAKSLGRDRLCIAEQVLTARRRAR